MLSVSPFNLNANQVSVCPDDVSRFNLVLMQSDASILMLTSTEELAVIHNSAYSRKIASLGVVSVNVIVFFAYHTDQLFLRVILRSCFFNTEEYDNGFSLTCHIIFSKAL